MPLITLPDVGSYLGNKMTNSWHQPKNSMTSTAVVTDESAESNSDKNNSIFQTVTAVLQSCNAYEEFPFDDEDLDPPDTELITLPIASGHRNGQHLETQPRSPIIDQLSIGPAAPLLELKIGQANLSKQDTSAGQAWSQSSMKNTDVLSDKEEVFPNNDQSSAGLSVSLLTPEIDQIEGENAASSADMDNEREPSPKGSTQRSSSSSAHLVEEEAKTTASQEPDVHLLGTEEDIHQQEGMSEVDKLRNAELDHQYAKACQCIPHFLSSAVRSATQAQLLHKFDFSEPSVASRMCRKMSNRYTYKGNPGRCPLPVAGDDDMFEIRSDSDEEPKPPSPPFDSPTFTKSNLQRRIELQRQPTYNIQGIYDSDDFQAMEHYVEVQTQRRIDECLVFGGGPSPVLGTIQSEGSSTSRKRARLVSTTSAALGFEEEEDWPRIYYDPSYSQPSVRQTARKAAFLMSQAFEQGHDIEENGKARSSKQSRKRKEA